MIINNDAIVWGSTFDEKIITEVLCSRTRTEYYEGNMKKYDPESTEARCESSR